VTLTIMNTKRSIPRAIAVAILSVMMAGPRARAASRPVQIESRTEQEREREQRRQRADQAVQQLWSAELIVRESAKATLVSLGDDAVPLLVSLLNDVATNDRERYETGMDVSGPELRKVLEIQVRSADANKRMQAARLLAGLDISQRLESDACEVVGALHAVEAVPILATLSWSRSIVEIGLSFRTYLTSPSINALVEIGRPAVAQIVMELESADSTAAVEFRSRFTQAGSEVSDLLGRMRSLSFGPKIKTREDLANRIRSTLANVLGQIGDERALPALEKLSEKSDDSEVRFYSRQAISMLGARRYRGY